MFSLGRGKSERETESNPCNPILPQVNVPSPSTDRCSVSFRGKPGMVMGVGLCCRCLSQRIDKHVDRRIGE